jgi:hypothetical protein
MFARKHMMTMIIIRNEFEDGKCINHFETGFGPPDLPDAVKNNDEASGELDP